MRKALVVGINKYPTSPLKGCVNDAEAVSRILQRNGDNSPNFHIRTELDVETKGKLKGMIIDCFSRNDDVALFYFSGHGFIDSIGGYLVTPDYCQHDWGVSMHEILEIINDSQCKNKIIILDCCHSGFIGSISTGKQGITYIKEGVTILSASRSNESAVEINGHGVFTSLLIAALNGGAADITGHITPGGVYAYIDKALGPWQQRPLFKTNVMQFTSLRTVIPQVDVEVLRKIINYFSAPDIEFLLNPSFEPTNTQDVDHEVIEPFANETNIGIFKNLQQLESVGLIVPCEEDHMYYAAMHSKSCKLTSIGQHYWHLVRKNII